MAEKKISTKNSFNAGEISPRLYSRQDVSKYANGLKTATNCFVTPHGPVHRRNGSQFIKEVKTSANATYLLKYQFSNTEYYILEFGNLYIRFYTDGGVLGAPYEVVTPYTTAQISAISYVQKGRSIYLVHPGHAPRKLTRNGDTDWDIETMVFNPPPTYEAGDALDTTCTPAATTGTGITFTLGGTLALKADIGRQIVNDSTGEVGTAIITANPTTSTYTCDITVDFTNTDAIASGDWHLDLSPIAELTPDGLALGSLINIESDLIGTANPATCFRSTDVGKYIYLSGGVVKVIELVSTSSVNCEVINVLDTTDETAIWTLETDTWDATRGFPRAVGLSQGRLIFASSETLPSTVWMSETGVFTGFTVGTEASDSIQLDISSKDSNKITWISNSRDLVVGTTGAEITIDEGGATSLTPTSARVVGRTYHGSNEHVPITISNETVFIQSSQLKLRSFRYDFNIDGYTGEDLTFLAEHITEEKISRIAYAQEPNRIIYAVLENGDMLVGTYMREQQVLGWCRYTTDGSYEDVQVVTNGSEDEVWAVINRTVNGSAVRYIELFDNGSGEDRLDGFSDSFLTYSDPKIITGATAADPGVITTSTNHGYSDGDRVRILDVVGMTELNQNKYVVARKTNTTFELESTSAHSSIVSPTYRWIESGSGTSEYYVELAAGGDPSLTTSITAIFEDDSRMTEAAVGSLSASEWDFGDNDSLGFSTIYVRLSGSEDPDSKGQGWVEYALGADSSAFTAYGSAGEVHKLVMTISGLTHLEAKTVQVKTDGAESPDKTVASGSITLSEEAYEVVVGISYTTTIELLPMSFDVGLGEMQGQDSRWTRPILRVYKSYIPAVNDIITPSRLPSDLLNQPVGLFTGDLVYNAGTFKDSTGLVITASDAGPLRLGGIFGTLAGGVK